MLRAFWKELEQFFDLIEGLVFGKHGSTNVLQQSGAKPPFHRDDHVGDRLGIFDAVALTKIGQRGWGLAAEDRLDDALIEQHPVRLQPAFCAFAFHLCDHTLQQSREPGVMIRLFGRGIGYPLGQRGRLGYGQRDQFVLRDPPCGSVLAVLFRRVLAKGMEQKSPEPASGWIRTPHEVSAQDDLVKKTLGQVFGLFVVIAFAPQVAIDGLPVLLQ